MGTAGKVPAVVCVLTLSLAFVNQGRAQQMHFEQLTVADGLPDANVLSILQDRLGFLWIGTGRGVVRYDGHTMDVFDPDPENPHSVASGPISSLYEDEDGTLWIGTEQGGLCRFNRKSETFTCFVYAPDNLSSLASNAVERITGDRKGYVWVQTSGSGVNRVDPASNRIFRYRHDPANSSTLSGDATNDMIVDRSGNVWVGTSTGLNRFDPASETFIRYRHDPDDPKTLADDAVEALAEGRDGAVWIGTGSGLDRFDPGTGRIDHYLEDSKEHSDRNSLVVTSLLLGRNGLLWIGTHGALIRLDQQNSNLTRHFPISRGREVSDAIVGIHEDRTGLLWVRTSDRRTDADEVYTFDPETGVFTNQSAEPDNPDGIAVRGQVKTLFEDRTGTMWIGTSLGGLNRLDRTRQTFSHNSAPTGKQHSGNVRAIYEDSHKRVWIATGVLEPNPHDVALRLKNPRTGSETDYQLGVEDRYSTNPNFVNGIFEDSRSQFWLLTDQGLRRFYPATGADTLFVPYPDAENPSDNVVLKLFEDQRGMFWVGTLSGGLLQFNPASGAFTRSYRYDPDDPQSIPSARINDIAGNREGTIWLGTGRGLVRFDPHSDRFKLIEDTDVGRFNVKMIHDDGRGRLWLATWPRGLVRFNKATGDLVSFRHFGELFLASVSSVVEDQVGNLWLSSDLGLTRFDPAKGIVKNYALSDGLGQNRFNDRAVLASSDGQLYFGGKHGLTSFGPQKVRVSREAPEVILTGLRIFNREVLPSPDGPLKQYIAEASAIHLSHDQNDVTFEFAAFNYADPASTQYSYKLDGYEKDWRNVGSQRTAIYPDLPPGDYTFRVKAANGDGAWAETGASIHLVIAPSRLEARWLYGLFVVVIVSLLYGAVRLQSRRTRIARPEKVADGRIAKGLDERQGLEVVSTRSVDPSRADLAGATGNGYGGSAEDYPPGEILTPSFRGTEVYRQPGELVGFLHHIVRSFSPLAERRRITLSFRPETDVQPLVFDSEVVCEVISSLLSNALKLTPEGGRVWLTTATGLETIEIAVKDTGPGIPVEEREHLFDRYYHVYGLASEESDATAIGLALARELVELHVGTLSVRTKVGVGSQFIIRLPLEIPYEQSENGEASSGDGAVSQIPEVLVRSAPSRAEAPPSAQEGRSVLVVDDNRDVRELLRIALEANYSVFQAADGLEGLRAARAHRPDLILSDVMMLHMDGIEMCRRIRSDDALKSTPVILLTTKEAVTHELHGLECGADDYLFKPFGKGEAQIRVTNLLLSHLDPRCHPILEELGSNPERWTPEEQELVGRTLEVLQTHLRDDAFSLDQFAAELSTSRRKVVRRLRAAAGVTPVELLDRLKIERARQLLEIHPGTVHEVARELGFRSAGRLSAAFRKAFGYGPPEHV